MTPPYAGPGPAWAVDGFAGLRYSLSEVAMQARDSIKTPGEAPGQAGPVDGLGITVQIDGQIVFGGVNDFTCAVDDLQYDLGEGPCLQAQHSGVLVASRTIAAGERRWPLFSPRAAELGLRSVVSAPLAVTDDTTGSLNVYGTSAERLTHVRPTLMQEVAATIEEALRTVLRDADRTPARFRGPGAEPRETIGSRTAGLGEAELRRLVATLPVIEQAKGVLMGYYGVDADTAFTVLNRWSSARQTKLRDVCATLLERVVATPRPDFGGGLQALLAPAHTARLATRQQL